MILLRSPNQPILSSYILLTGLGTSISMLISGLSGSYLSEKAELKKERKELERAMGVLNKKEEEESVDDLEDEVEEIQKAMVVPPNHLNQEEKKKFSIKRKKKEKKVKTLREKAERFTGIIISIVNGVSPFLGGVVAIIPFFFVEKAGMTCFITSFIIIFVCIIFLGIFLGYISEESIPKNILQMVAAFTLTIIITLLILGG